MANAAPKFASGRRAKFACPRCGEVSRYDAARYEWHTKTWVCRDCVDELPLDRKPIKYVVDGEALRHPRQPNENEVASPQIPQAAFNLYAWTGTPELTIKQNVSGAEALFAAGNVVIVTAQITQLLGVEFQAQAGTAGRAIAFDAPGAGAVLAAGTPALSIGKNISGASAALSAGAIGRIIARPLTGAAATSAAGTVSVETDPNGWGKGAWSAAGWGE